MTILAKRISKASIYVFLTVTSLYMIIYIFLPSKINVFEGEKVKISNVVPASLSSNPQTKGIIEYDFSSDSLLGENCGSCKAFVSVAGIPVKEVSINVLPSNLVIPVGNVKGIVLNYDGVLVLGTGEFENENGEKVSPSKGYLKTGDMIESINGEKINSKEEVMQIVEESEGKAITMSVIRGGENKEINILPAISISDGKYKIGCWIRGETQGLGTITYVEPKSRKFGALGHGVYDADTKKLTEIKDGKITESFISGIKKSEKGLPGEIVGSLNKKEILGTIENNTECGIFGTVKNISDFEYTSVAAAGRNEIETGKAYILSDAIDGKTEKYDIEIESLSGFGRTADKSMIIAITDERLLEKTGGIVQGLSGSPIIQNGKLVGAVTHVFVNDPKRGYGIFIENMIGVE